MRVLCDAPKTRRYSRLPRPVGPGRQSRGRRDIVARHGLHFDPARQRGVVFHMISCLTEFGRVGLTAVGDTPASAKAMYEKAERILLQEARESLAERPLLA